MSREVATASRKPLILPHHGCTPDVVTYTALITAFDRAGQWHRALQTFERMQQQGCAPDHIVFTEIGRAHV